jgi:hypothetical protein
MTNKLSISFGSYGNYSSDNYATHCLRLNIGELTLYFSYKTVVAFSDGFTIYVSENLWGSTTGKHLNWIDDGNKKERLKRPEFEKLLEEKLKKHNLVIAH